MTRRRMRQELYLSERPTERQALNNLTLAELEDMALQIIRKRELSREAYQARRAQGPLTDRSAA